MGIDTKTIRDEKDSRDLLESWGGVIGMKAESAVNDLVTAHREFDHQNVEASMSRVEAALAEYLSRLEAVRDIAGHAKHFGLTLHGWRIRKAEDAA